MTTRDLQQCVGRGGVHPAKRPGAVAALGLGAAATALAVGLAASMQARERPEATTGDAGVVLSLGARLSHSGLYRAGVVAHTGPWQPGSPQSWVVRVTSTDGTPVPDATVRAAVWRPETGEHAQVQPRVSSHLGEGRYRIDGLVFPKPGWWNVPLQIIAREGVDSLAFNVILPEPSAKTSGASERGKAP